MLTKINLLQVFFFLSLSLLLVKPLGSYMAKVYSGKAPLIGPLLTPLEKLLYRLCGIEPKQEMDWKAYLIAMLIFNLFGVLATYLIQRLQAYLPLNPQAFSAPTPDLALNTAASFVTNTNWQAYSGETSLSYFTQMLALTTQNFLSAATGLSLVIALSRGLSARGTNKLGNFWVDTVRGILFILLPLSFIFALGLVSQGVIQNFKPNQKITLLEPLSYQPQETAQASPQSITEQVIPMGPVASQIAIKQLGTNGGGFFNTNSAHPFENPTPLSNFFELLAIILLPASLCYTFGLLVMDKRQGWALLTAMYLVFIPFLILDFAAEQAGNPAITALGINPTPDPNTYPAGNMEGKESRFGILNSTLWAVATTATSNGSVNSMHDSYTPLGGFIPLWMMHLGEVIFGGLGSGLYGILMLVIISVFVAGLMVGRTPEYLGKKIEPYEMKMASIAVLVMPLIVLLATALSSVLPTGITSRGNPSMHGFTEILYAFTSMGNNNGSAFAGLNANTPYYNLLGTLIMLISRYWIAIPILAIAGSLAHKKFIPSNSGTLATHTPMFIIILISITLLIGALSFLPALALGPIVENLRLWGPNGQ